MNRFLQHKLYVQFKRWFYFISLVLVFLVVWVSPQISQCHPWLVLHLVRLLQSRYNEMWHIELQQQDMPSILAMEAFIQSNSQVSHKYVSQSVSQSTLNNWSVSHTASKRSVSVHSQSDRSTVWKSCRTSWVL